MQKGIDTTSAAPPLTGIESAVKMCRTKTYPCLPLPIVHCLTVINSFHKSSLHLLWKIKRATYQNNPNFGWSWNDVKSCQSLMILWINGLYYNQHSEINLKTTQHANQSTCKLFDFHLIQCSKHATTTIRQRCKIANIIRRRWREISREILAKLWSNNDHRSLQYLN